MAEPTGDLLRQAAAKLRDHAEVATPGPWTAVGESLQAPVGSALEVTGYNARYFALMHPPVALALANLLDEIAAHNEATAGTAGATLLNLARVIVREEANGG